MRTAATIILLAVLCGPVATAQTMLSPYTERGLSCWGSPEPMINIAGLGDAIEMTTDNAAIEADGSASFSGPVVMRSRDKLIKADSATYNASSATFTAAGDVEFQAGANKITGESLIYNAQAEVFTFTEGSFESPALPGRGTASKLEVRGAGFLELNDVIYTSCPPGNNDWLLKAKRLEIDNSTGIGKAHNASLSFKGVPFLYVPYFSYPVTDKRKSGLLFPRFSSSEQRGLELETPVYWNIRPNMDATFVPRYMEKRGLQLGTEYRYLARKHEGLLWGDYLPDDKETSTARWHYDVATESILLWDSRASITAAGVSDNAYFEDMSTNRQQTSLTNLDRRLDIERYSRHWSMFVRAQNYQTIDDLITPTEEPYAQIPQLVVNGDWRNGLLGLDYALDTEAVYFYRDDSTNGARVHVQPEVSLPLNSHGLYLTPKIALDYTTYWLQDQPVGETNNPDRLAPIGSVDTGVTFDRLAGKNNGLLITLEPRALYAYIPFREQSDIPVFDTIRPDFNLVQLFRTNRFVGYDRLGDTSQLSVGLTSRILDAYNGRQLLAVTIGQTRYFNEASVALPDDTTANFDASDYIAELDVRAWDNWNAGGELQWDAERSEADRASVRLQYRPGPRKSVNAAYRFVRDSTEQTDFAFAWPLGDKWSAIGRYNYSLLEKTALDRFLGVEFESCCWSIRLLGRRSIVRSTGELDTSISFQFELKGFSNVGSGSITTLERGILGDWTR